MKHLFVVNPIAGGRNAEPEIRVRVEAAFRRRPGSYEIYVTRGPRDATEKIRREADTGEELRVYACGGDGTFNECICGAAERANVSVCPYPTGTGNDFCRMFGEQAARFQDLDALLEGSIRPIDLIACNESYSVNICSVGIDARIGTDAHTFSSLPLVGGTGAYIISTIVNACRGIATDMRIQCCGKTYEGKFSLVCVCNGRFYGGGFNPSLHARVDDGVLDILIAKKVSLFNFARLIGKYAKGQADELPEHVVHLQGSEIQIDFDTENVINLDGEALYSDTVRMRVLPRALNLLVPKGIAAGAPGSPLSEKPFSDRIESA